MILILFLKLNYFLTDVLHMFPHDNQLYTQLSMTRWCGCTELSHDSVHILVDTQHHNILDHTLLKKNTMHILTLDIGQYSEMVIFKKYVCKTTSMHSPFSGEIWNKCIHVICWFYYQLIPIQMSVQQRQKAFCSEWQHE